jgi:hypothetical protein
MATFYSQGSNNIIFVHIPKTAGTSISTWLKSHMLDSDYYEIHYNHPFIHKLEESTSKQIVGIKPKVTQSPFVFSIVRNPWAWAFSVYQNLKLSKTNEILNVVSEVTKLNNGEFPTFNKFISLCPNIKYHIGQNGWGFQTTQSTWLKIPDTNVDLIIRYENLNNDFKQIQDLFKSTVPLDHMLKGILPSNEYYREQYNQSSKKIIETMCLEDIDNFKYTF